jgi:hypothetical protein
VESAPRGSGDGRPSAESGAPDAAVQSEQGWLRRNRVAVLLVGNFLILGALIVIATRMPDGSVPAVQVVQGSTVSAVLDGHSGYSGTYLRQLGGIPVLERDGAYAAWAEVVSGVPSGLRVNVSGDMKVYHESTASNGQLGQSTLEVDVSADANAPPGRFPVSAKWHWGDKSEVFEFDVVVVGSSSTP